MRTRGRLGRSARAHEHLTIQLLATKLNIRDGHAEHDEPLRQAFLYGREMRVREVVDDADALLASVAGPQAASPDQIVEMRRIAELLDAVNNGEVTYIEPRGSVPEESARTVGAASAQSRQYTEHPL